MQRAIRLSPILVAGLGVLVSVVFVAGLVLGESKLQGGVLRSLGHQEPFALAAQHDTLVIRDRSGRRIASHVFPFELLPYRDHDRRFDIEDINGDGIRELVVGTACNGGMGRGEVHLLDGATRSWRTMVRLDRRLEGRRSTHTARFVPQLVRILHDAQGHPVSILVGAANQDASLGYLIEMDFQGRERGILWTWGHPNHGFEEMDLDDDGDPEILAHVRHDIEGQSAAAMLVLKRGQLSGFVPHPSDVSYFPPDAPTDGYLAYVLFPPSRLLPPEHKNYIRQITRFEGSGRIKVVVTEQISSEIQGQIWFWLTKDLRVQQVQFHDNYKKACAQVGCPYDDAAAEELAEAVEVMD